MKPPISEAAPNKNFIITSVREGGRKRQGLLGELFIAKGLVRVRQKNKKGGIFRMLLREA